MEEAERNQGHTSHSGRMTPDVSEPWWPSPQNPD